MMNLQKIAVKIFYYLPAVLSWLVPLLFYVYHISPSVQLEDAGELTTAVISFGIPHPSGYPLYVLLAGVWSWFWGGSILAVNLFSATLAAVACYFIYLSASQLGARPWLAMVGAWLMAGAPGFWSQALIAEVYTLHTALVVIVLYLLIKLRNKPELFTAYLIYFFSGLAITNHLLAIFLVPLVIISVARYYGSLTVKNYLTAAVFFIIGLIPYLYLPFRAAQQPLLNWGNPANWYNFWQHVLRLSYNDVGLVTEGSKFGLFSSFIKQFVDSFSWPIIILAVFGAGVLVWQKKKVVFLLISLMLLQSLPVIVLRNFGWGIGIDFTYRVYWFGSLAAIAVLIPLCLTAFWNNFILKSKNIYSFRFFGTVIIILLIPWSIWLNNLNFISYRNDAFPSEYAAKLINSLPPNSVLYIGGEGYNRDSVLFLVTYAKIVQNLRPDVMVVDGGPIFLPKELIHKTKPLDKKLPLEIIDNDWLRLLWKFSTENHRPLYTTSLIGVNRGLVGRPDGYCYRIFGSVAEAKTANLSPELFWPQAWSVERMNSYSGQDYLASLNYIQSSALADLGSKAALGTFLDAIKYDNEAFSLEYKAYIYHRALFKQ